MRRRQWFDWHSWVGFNLSVLMSFVLLTGTLATLAPELDWLSNPAKRATSDAPAATLPLGSMLANFQRTFPDASASTINVPRERWIAPELIGTDADGSRFRVFFDPATGAVQGTGRWYNWQRFLRQAHRHLMLPLQIGLTVVALLSIPLLVTFVSSLYVYKRWWRGFFRWPPAASDDAAAVERSNKTRRRFWGDVHRLSGVWSLWFVLLMAITGVWYLVEHFGLNATLPTFAQPAATSEGPRLLDGQPEALDRLLATALLEYPELEVYSVLLNAQGGAVVVQGQARALLVRHRANHVAFDGSSGELIDLRRGETLDIHNRISEAADPLHFGDFGGAPTRYIWAFFGFLMTLLSISGVYLFGLRALSSAKHVAASARAVWSAAVARVPRSYLFLQSLLVLVSLSIGAYMAL